MLRAGDIGIHQSTLHSCCTICCLKGIHESTMLTCCRSTIICVAKAAIRCHSSLQQKSPAGQSGCLTRLTHTRDTALLSAAAACRYFKRLQKRYAPNAEVRAALADAEEQSATAVQNSCSNSPQPSSLDQTSSDQNLQVPITCINLLRCNMQVVSVPTLTLIQMLMLVLVPVLPILQSLRSCHIMS